jgi:hypothetical protein
VRTSFASHLLLFGALACSSTPSGPAAWELGALAVTSSTSGTPFLQHILGATLGDRYSLELIGVGTRQLRLNDHANWSGLEPKTYQLLLRVGAPNCTVQGPNPRPVTVKTATLTREEFQVVCGPAAGLEVRVSTEGGTPDPDGYLVRVSGQEDRPIGTSGAVAFAALAPGAYLVSLRGLATNCLMVGPGSLTVSLGAGKTTLVEFRVFCPSPPPPSSAPGSLEISVRTNAVGVPLPNQFSVSIDRGPGLPISANGSLVVTPIAAGTYTVTLLAQYCFVSSGSGLFNREVTVLVPAGGTGKAHFSVLCVP